MYGSGVIFTVVVAPPPHPAPTPIVVTPSPLLLLPHTPIVCYLHPHCYCLREPPLSRPYSHCRCQDSHPLLLPTSAPQPLSTIVASHPAPIVVACTPVAVASTVPPAIDLPTTTYCPLHYILLLCAVEERCALLIIEENDCGMVCMCI